jgi:ubiquitin-conjugating enzyme E2 Z
MTLFISKECMNRLLKDVKQIIKNPLTENGIYYIHDDTDMMKGYAVIIGPSDTPYFGGNFFFEFNYPTDYPHSPPKVKYWTNGNGIRFNPNLYTSGKVCVSLLNTWRGDQWTSCQTISTVLLTLCTLLCNNPLLNEPGVIKNNQDIPGYNEIIQFANIDVAICDIIEKKKNVYIDFFENFYPFVKENFIHNYDKILDFAEKKNIEYNGEVRNFRTNFYSMNIYVDYNYIIKRLKDTKEFVETQNTK